MESVVKYFVQENVAVVTINNPPANALGQAVRVGLLDAIDWATAEDAVSAILIHAQGPYFSAGADIREFDGSAKRPSLPEVCDRIEASTKPVVTALHGVVLGGGFEIALASHYRIADANTTMGLPEVTLGLVPGAGGTQRLPRLCGATNALGTMLSGKPIGAKTAHSQGIIDRITKGDVLTAGLDMARDIVAQELPALRTIERHEGLAEPLANLEGIENARAKASGIVLFAHTKIIDCVEASILLPTKAGKLLEADAFEACLASDQSAALRHAFFAERRAAKVPECETGRVRDVARFAVVGASDVGIKIALSALAGGLDVVLLERDRDALEVGMAQVASVLDRMVAKRRISAAEKDGRTLRFSGTTNYADLGAVDLAIETMAEEREAKEDVFARLDAALKPGAVLATNTCHLDIDELAATISRPEDVVGLHFTPKHSALRLIEVVVADSTSDDVVATCFALAKRLGKIAVRARVTDGYIGNRIQDSYRMAAEHMVEDGASPYQVDQAMLRYGFKTGPFQTYDLEGLDVIWAKRKRNAAARDPEARNFGLVDKLCESGWFGQKNGCGFYRYDGAGKRGVKDQEVLDLIAAERGARGIVPKNFSEDEIQRRCLAAMINAGAKLLEDGIVLRPSDIDVVMIHGYGFPRWKGGPMKAADLTGLLQVLNDLKAYGAQDGQFWQPSQMFDGLIRNGDRFEVLNG